jgi:hypothetical protein
MADEKSSKGDDGRGVPAAAEQKTVEPAPADARLIPGGSFRAARRPVGVNGLDHYTEPPVVKADLPDLSNVPGWHMMPKGDKP